MKALVTGASEGIGRAFAKQLAEQGWQVTVAARNEARLKELVAELPGGPHAYRAVDLLSESGVATLTSLMATEKFNLLINNAGLTHYSAFRDMDKTKISATMDLNVTCLITLSSAFLKSAVKGDSIINVSSSASFLPMPIASLYTGAKSFVTSFSESLWYEERKRGVYVMALCPGATRTEFHTRAGGKRDEIPVHLSQTPEQVARRGLKALRCRSAPVVRCGQQRPLIFLSRFIPRKWVIWISGKTLDATVHGAN